MSRNSPIYWVFTGLLALQTFQIAESFISIQDNGQNITTTAPEPTKGTPGEKIPTYWGYIAAGIAVLFFGSNFAPIKKFETGDGIFFQWILCSAIWITGLVVNVIQNFPTFYPLAMLGGFLWATGNICVVPIIKTIGLGLGLLIWGSFNLLSGWASGRFGWFGLKPENHLNPVLNDIGVTLAALSAIIYLFVKTEIRGVSEDLTPVYPSEEEPLIPKAVNSDDVKVIQKQNFVDTLSPKAKRILGCSLSAISGIFYGVNFVPVIYIQDNYENGHASKNGLDYIFSHFCGIYLTSTCIFTAYCMAKRNKPDVYPKAILPGFVSGVMWAVAQSSWFVANATLSEPVSFPIITTGPGIVAALWGVFVFKEIRGFKNLAILCLAFAVTISGAVISGVSKLGDNQTGNSTTTMMPTTMHPTTMHPTTIHPTTAMHNATTMHNVTTMHPTTEHNTTMMNIITTGKP
ncbi:unnamed protein product [Owenia fusiformis]|uniref:Uncharacterized protein n=1 Tax=Owenia fusiformis TaxID=6347 RepID=A0A8J1THR2_OWEFU|nr:unnamed protein product [Owenia fusiformis]